MKKCIRRPEMAKNNVCNVNLRNMPPHVVRCFKAYCTARGVPMNKAVAYLMREAVNDQRKVSDVSLTVARGEPML